MAASLQYSIPMILLLVTLLAAKCSCTILYGANQTITWPNLQYVVKNVAAIPLNMPPNVPYSMMEDGAEGLFKGTCDFTGLPDMCHATISNQYSYFLRADNPNQPTLTIATVVGGVNVAAYSILSNYYYTRYFSNGSSSIITVTIQHAGNTNNCSNLVSVAIIGGVEYSIYAMDGQMCLVPTNLGHDFNGTVRIADFSSYFLGSGDLDGKDILTDFQISLEGGSMLDYFINGSLQLLQGRSHHLENSFFSIGAVAMENYIVQPALFSSDYCNISYDTTTLSFSSVVVDFQFVERAPTTQWFSYARISMGYLPGNWSTQQGLYGLPMLATDASVGLLVDFTFTEADSLTPTGKAACVTMQLRKDYDPASGSYSDPSVFPVLQVQVCPWTSPNISPLPQQIGSVLDGSIIYSLATETMWDSTNMTSWPSYCFTAQVNQPNTLQLDLTPFLRFIDTNVVTLTNYYVVTVYIGFKCYAGKGSFSLTAQPQITSVVVAQPKTLTNNTIVPVPVPVPVPIPVPVPSPTVTEATCLLFSTFDNQTQSCVMSSSGEVVKKGAVAMFSVPNVGLLLRLTPMASIIDDLSYYSYHMASYDSTFQLLANLCWQVNNQKWVPSFIEGPYQQLSRALSAIDISDWAKATPERMAKKGETLWFIDNAQDFWLSRVPISLLTFFLFMLLRKKVRYGWVRSSLQGFSTVSYLGVSLLGENVGYLSFRCFQQMRFLVARTPLQYLSIAMALTSLFLVVLSMGCLYLVIWGQRNKQFKTEHLLQRLDAYAILNISLAASGLDGFCNAFIDDPLMQIPCLLAVSVAKLLLYSYYFSTYRKKRTFCVHFVSMAVKALLNLILYVQINLESTLATLQGEIVFSELTSALASALFLCLVLDQLLIYTNSLVLFFNKLTRNKIQLQGSDGTPAHNRGSVDMISTVKLFCDQSGHQPLPKKKKKILCRLHGILKNPLTHPSLKRVNFRPLRLQSDQMTCL